MGPRVYYPLMSQEPMFQILAQPIEEIQSSWPAKLGTEFGHLWW